jgi:signal transduction histidine kinase
MGEGRAISHIPSALALARNPRETRRALLHLGAEIVAYRDVTDGLIHEIRNPLQSLLFAARTLAEFPNADPEGKFVGVMTKAAESAAASIELLSGVADRRSDEPPVLLQDVIARVLAWQQRSRFQIDGRVTSSIPPNTPPIAAAGRDLETSLMLIVNNAKEAIGRDQPGTVEIVVAVSPEQGRVIVATTDTGPGIPPDLMEHVFGLFMTTKDDHLGIGLPAVRSFLETLGGTVLLRNRVGCGAICEMSLPAWRGSNDGSINQPGS